ncbi:Cysteine-rich receptor-like protein kinase 25 [Cinnamomum micranthum f. kanehirae]|uniref:Cysteine-rich receptor-like protein kinase 25 n=1 Tax=Cinnamomum micranthum f. kanehirae TaxID=337451 RepID=A0A443PBZ6_9MAGN|nr:Cysteine-rich receptor-like protein kinase 25 [Cinnamomum micranthum f. kanehirae]
MRYEIFPFFGSSATTTTEGEENPDDYGEYIANIDSILFDFNSIKVATNNFSYINKLGECGFGPLFKAKLPNGKELAVKRLSRHYGQGIEEFKNEDKEFQNSDNAQNLLQYTWKLWQEGHALELMDSSLGDKCSRSETLRIIYIGLLCVQEDASDRPTMSTVVLMLSSNSTTLYMPKQPAFVWGKSPVVVAISSNTSTIEYPISPSYDISLSEFQPR